MFFRFVTTHECDRRTDRQNYDSQDRASIAASRGKNNRRCKYVNITTNFLFGETKLAVACVGVHDEERVDAENDAYQHEAAAAAEHHRTPRLIQPTHNSSRHTNY